MPRWFYTDSGRVRYFSLSDIKQQYKPTVALPPDYFRSHIDLLESTFDGYPSL